MNRIEVEGLTKTMGTSTILDDVTLEFESGKIYGLMGRNGSGKTVFLKLIAGGAHAKTVLGCAVLSYGVYVGVLFINRMFSLQLMCVIFVLTITVLICIIALTPVEHPNKLFTIVQKEKLKLYSIRYSVVICMLQFVMCIMKKYECNSLIFLCTIVVLSNQVIGKLINNRRAKS